MGAIDSGLDRAADATHTEAHPFRHLWKRSQRLSAALEPGEKIVVLLGEPGAIRFTTGHSSRSKEMCSPSSIAAALKRGKNTAGSSERSRLQSCGPRSDAWSTVTQRSLTRAYTASLKLPPATVSAATSFNQLLSPRQTHGLRPTVPSALVKESWRIRSSGKLRQKPALVHPVYIPTSNSVVTGASSAKMESRNDL